MAAADVGHLQVRVQEQIEGEGDVLAGVVDADVEVQLLLAQDQPVRYSEAGGIGYSVSLLIIGRKKMGQTHG